MIRVTRQSEPDDFDEKVRQPGSYALGEGYKPTDKGKDYWTACLRQLWNRYGRICAYRGVYIHPGSGDRTVDHFKPKSKPAYYKLAYEWNNYRLASRRANDHKGKHEDVLDPFTIEDGWFCLEFPECTVSPSPELDDVTRERVQDTIDRLQFNLDPEFVEQRQEDFTDYMKNRDQSLAEFERRSPFIAREIRRQKWRRPRRRSRARQT